MNLNVLRFVATALRNLLHRMGAEKGDYLCRKSCRGGSLRKVFHSLRLITSFFEQFALRCFDQGIIFFALDISSQSGWDFNDPFVYGNAKLLHQNKLPALGEGQNRDYSARFATFNVLPVAFLFDPEKVTFK